MVTHPTRHTKIVSVLTGLLCLLIIAAGQGAQAACSTDGPLPAPDTPSTVISTTAPRPDAGEAARQRAREAFAQLPHYFIANAGQLDAQVAFYARSQGHTLYFTPADVVLALPQDILRLQFVGASRQVQIQGSEPTQAQVNYFIGNDPAQWRTGIPTFHEVVYHELYPGIDAHFTGLQQGELKYTFVVQPGAAAEQIRLAYTGATGLRLDAHGDLIIETGSTSLKDSHPYVYQEIDGQRIEVESAFALRDDRGYGFTIIGDYDHSYPLVIDPGLVYSTYLGGSNMNDYGNGIAIDSAGCAYVTGSVESTDFPTKNAYDSSHNGDFDVFVTKIDTHQSGTASLLYSTFLGGTDEDRGESIDVDGSGYVYVTGYTWSTDFPTKNAYDTTFNGGYDDVFVAKLDMTLSGTASLLYSTFVGGNNSERGHSIVATGTGIAYVTGETQSTDLPTTLSAYDSSHNGSNDAFVTKLDTTQSGSGSLLYSTYLGGTAWDHGNGIAATSTGIAYVVGATASNDFPTKNAYDPSHNGGSDVFMTKLDTTQSGAACLLYSTYLGGSGGERGFGIAVGRGASAYVTGWTASTDFPTLNAYDSSHNGSHDAFVAKFDTTETGGASLLYSTYLGGSSDDEGYSIASVSYLYVTGYTGSANFPTLDAYDSSLNGTYDVFVAKFGSGSGTASLLYSTYLGGSDYDVGNGIAVNSAGCAYVAGCTASTDFPTTSNAYDTTYSGGWNDVFVAKLGWYFYLPRVVKTY